MSEGSSFQIGDYQISPGERRTVDLPVSVLPDHTPVNLSVHIVNGHKPGPVMFVSAAIHGDEIIGVEIVRRLLDVANLGRLNGTLLAIPIVNAFGFMNHSRYLPDRRDLNRSFPGSAKGSLASRLADLFLQEIVARSDYGVDLHSAAIHRNNLPQIRISPGDDKLLSLATAFGPPLILTSNLREGSLRAAAQEMGVGVLLYEAGEGLRFDENAVRTGVSGILRVMRQLGMVSGKGIRKASVSPIKVRSSFWLRAPAGGLLRTFKTIGDAIEPGDKLGVISDPFGEVDTELSIDQAGLIIGRTELPIINEGDGLFHVARLRRDEDAESTIDSLTAQLDDDPLFDEDEII